MYCMPSKTTLITCYNHYEGMPSDWHAFHTVVKRRPLIGLPLILKSMSQSNLLFLIMETLIIYYNSTS